MVNSDVSAEVARKPDAKPHFDVPHRPLCLPQSAPGSKWPGGGDQRAKLFIATTVKSKDGLD
jgi:hypothetical protein